MWKLHRYYLKELVVHFAITFLVLFAVMLVSLIYKGIQRAVGGNMWDAVRTTVLFALDTMQHLLTIAFLIATVTTFVRAAQDRELMSIRAAGIAPRAPMLPAVLVGLVLAIVGSLSLNYLIPTVHYLKYRVVAGVLREAILKTNYYGDRLPLLDSGYVLTSRRRETEGLLEDCTIYGPKPLKPGGSSILHVDRVSMPKPEGDQPWTVLLEGVHDPISGDRFAEFRITLSGFGGRDRRDERDDDMRSDQIISEVLRGVHPAPHEAIYTLNRRNCFALMPLVLAPIGYCIAEFARERGRVVALLYALVPLALFYLGEVLGARLLRSSGASWAGWLPMALLLLCGLPLCWRQMRR
jgi:lipopolysaccharide export LptBFGC system permease protein LptF